MTCLMLLGALIVAGADSAAPFRAVEIDPRFEGYLRAKPLLMEVPGAKVIHLDNGNQAVLAVASTVLRDDSADERLRAEKVCKLKALASLMAEKKGVQLAHVEQVKEKTVVVIEHGKEQAKNVKEVLQVTTAQLRGIAKDLAVVGRWWGGGSRRMGRCSTWPSVPCLTGLASRWWGENRPANSRSTGRAACTRPAALLLQGRRRPASCTTSDSDRLSLSRHRCSG
jgi:hypothetical protein